MVQHWFQFTKYLGSDLLSSLTWVLQDVRIPTLRIWWAEWARWCKGRLRWNIPPITGQNMKLNREHWRQNSIADIFLKTFHTNSQVTTGWIELALSLPSNINDQLWHFEFALFSFLNIFLEDITPFWTSGDICPGFQSQGGSLACMSCRLCAMDSSDSPLVLRQPNSWRAALQPSLFDLFRTWDFVFFSNNFNPPFPMIWHPWRELWTQWQYWRADRDTGATAAPPSPPSATWLPRLPGYNKIQTPPSTLGTLHVVEHEDLLLSVFLVSW